MHRHVLDRHLVEARGELHLDVELVRPLLQLGHERGPEHLLRRVDVERAPNHAVGEFLDRRDAKLRDIVAMPHGSHRVIGRQQQVDEWDLRELRDRRQFLPCPVLRLQRAHSGDEVVKEAGNPRSPLLRQFGRRRRGGGLGADLQHEDVMLDRIGEEDRVVNHRIVEGAAVRLVLQKLASFDAEDLKSDAADRPEQLVRVDMRLPVREADHRFVTARLRIDALRIFRRNVGEDLDLAAGEPVAFRMRVADGDSAVELGRSRHLLPEVFEDRVKRRLEIRVRRFDARTVAEEFPHEEISRPGI